MDQKGCLLFNFFMVFGKYSIACQHKSIKIHIHEICFISYTVLAGKSENYQECSITSWEAILLSTQGAGGRWGADGVVFNETFLYVRLVAGLVPDLTSGAEA